MAPGRTVNLHISSCLSMLEVSCLYRLLFIRSSGMLLNHPSFANCKVQSVTAPQYRKAISKTCQPCSRYSLGFLQRHFDEPLSIRQYRRLRASILRTNSDSVSGPTRRPIRGRAVQPLLDLVVLLMPIWSVAQTLCTSSASSHADRD